jgi:hypothetical protein
MKPNFENIPDELKRHKAWLMYRLLPSDKPGGKPRKVPFYTNGLPRSGTQGHVTTVTPNALARRLQALQVHALQSAASHATVKNLMLPLLSVIPVAEL